MLRYFVICFLLNTLKDLFIICMQGSRSVNEKKINKIIFLKKVNNEKNIIIYIDVDSVMIHRRYYCFIK